MCDWFTEIVGVRPAINEWDIFLNGNDKKKRKKNAPRYPIQSLTTVSYNGVIGQASSCFLLSHCCSAVEFTLNWHPSWNQIKDTTSSCDKSPTVNNHLTNRPLCTPMEVWPGRWIGELLILTNSITFNIQLQIGPETGLEERTRLKGYQSVQWIPVGIIVFWVFLYRGRKDLTPKLITSCSIGIASPIDGQSIYPYELPDRAQEL